MRWGWPSAVANLNTQFIFDILKCMRPSVYDVRWRNDVAHHYLNVPKCLTFSDSWRDFCGRVQAACNCLRSLPFVIEIHLAFDRLHYASVVKP